MTGTPASCRRRLSAPASGRQVELDRLDAEARCSLSHRCARAPRGRPRGSPPGPRSYFSTEPSVRSDRRGVEPLDAEQARAPPASRSPRRCPAASARRCRASARRRSRPARPASPTTPLHAAAHDLHLALRSRVVDPVVEAAALDRVVQVARAVRGQHDDRRVRGADRAELGDRHAGVRQQLEQERLEVVVGAVDLVDQQHRRPRAGVLERAQQRPADQVVGAEQVLLAQRRAARRRRAGCSAAGGGSSTRTAPRPRRCPRSTAAGSAACRARPRAPSPPRSCRRPPRPRAAAAAAGAGSGTSTSPGPRRRGSRRSASRCASVSMSGARSRTSSAASPVTFGASCAGMLARASNFGLAALAAEVDRLAVVLDRGVSRRRRRPSSRRSGRSPAAVLGASGPGTDSRRCVRCPGGRRRSSPGSRARSRRACARRCRGRPARRSASSSSSGTPSPRSSASTPCRACGWRRGRRSGRPASSPRRSVCSSSRPCAATTSARSPGRGLESRRRRRGDGVEPELGADRAGRAPAIGVSPTTSTRGAGRTGSRKTSIAPPDRHGFWTVTAPSSRGDLVARAALVVAERQDPQQQRLAALDRLAARTRARCAPRRRRRRSPRSSRRPSTSADVSRPRRSSGRCARTTVAVTNGSPRSASSLRPPRQRRRIIAAARAAPASPPRRAPGCTACRCGRRRASRAARRSPR